MKIRDILSQKKLTVSFEIFPPNKRMSLGEVMAASAAMSIQHPDFMSVTYGAAGGTKENTVKIASSLQEFLGIPSIAHLTCVATEKEQVKAIALEMKAAGIENPNGIHSLRHTFASLALRKGVDIKVISDILGHASVNFTYNSYVHIIDEQKINAVDLLNNI